MVSNMLNRSPQRKPATAVTLSIIMPGLGHVYCGRIVKGLLLAFLSCLVLPPVFVALIIDNAPLRVAIILGSLLASLVVYLIAVIDSWYTARHTTIDYQLKDYNRWYVYVLLILMANGASTQIAFNVKAYFLEAFIVPVASNYPTILPGERFLANKRAYVDADPQRGDLIVFINPHTRRNNIKRVVALAGDTVEIKNGELIVNGEQLSREPISVEALGSLEISVQGKPLTGAAYYEQNDDVRYRVFMADSHPENMPGDLPLTAVPAHHCFVLGDNRNLSDDSRKYGAVPLVAVKGRAEFLYAPVKGRARIGSLRP